MGDPMDELLLQIDEALARKGLSDAAASKLAVGNYALIKNLRSSRATKPEDRRTNFHALQKLAEVLGLECYFGPPRDTGPLEHVILDGRDFAHIPLHQASLAAGDGASNGDEEVIDHLAFRRSWLTRIGVSASNAVLARARGDSMLPCIHGGDIVLIDRSRRDVPVRPRKPDDTRPAPIYALLDGTGARIKRIERPEPDLVMLLSDNPSFPPEVLTGSKVASLDIIGKVMWWGHTNRE